MQGVGVGPVRFIGAGLPAHAEAISRFERDPERRDGGDPESSFGHQSAHVSPRFPAPEHTCLGYPALHCHRWTGITATSRRRKSGGSTSRPGDRWTEQPGGPMSLRRPSAAKWRSAWLHALLLAAISISFSFPTRAQTLPTAPQVASQINLGWNLGNTLEAICGETAWGNPATSQALINAVKAAGFNAIRIPVSWNCHITDGSTNIP